MQYQAKKGAILGAVYNKASLAKREEWINERRLILSNALEVTAKICAVMFPMYVLSYCSNSALLVSNISIIATLGLVCIASFIASRYLYLKYEKNIKPYR